MVIPVLVTIQTVFAIGLINHVGGILSPFAPTFGGKPLPNLTGWSHPGMNKPVPSNAF